MNRRQFMAMLAGGAVVPTRVLKQLAAAKEPVFRPVWKGCAVVGDLNGPFTVRWIDRPGIYDPAIFE